MNKTLTLNGNIISFGVPFVLFGILTFLMKSFSTSGNETLNLAITADLLLTVPLIYFLLIRKTTIPITTVFPVMLVGLLLGTYFLPKDSQTYLTLFKTWALPVLELTLVAYIVFKVRSVVSNYKRLKGLSPDFFSVLKSTCDELLPKKLVLLVATEVAVMYYGFISWKARTAQKNEFTYHKNSGASTLFVALMFIIVIEAFVLHLLLTRWNSTAAWIVTGLSIYAAIQVLGFAKSLSKRPVVINKNSLILRYGILNEVEIPFSNIEKIELSKKPLEKDKLTTTLSPLGELESHNVIISLKRESELFGIYGLKKRFKVIGFHIDEPAEFTGHLRKIQNN